MESLRYPIICHPSTPTRHPGHLKASNKWAAHIPIFFPHTQTHSLHISHRYSIAAAGTFEPQTPLFLHCSSLLSLHRQLSRALGCYHAPGNQRYSHMSQIGVNSYYSGEGVEGKWKLTYQKGHSSDITPPTAPLLSFSLSPFARPVLRISFFSFLHRPMIFDQ